MFRGNGSRGLTLLACLLFIATPVRAQDAPEVPEAGGDAPAVQMVKLNFPDDTNLKVLADFVAKRLELNLIYDSKQLATRQLTIRSTVEVPLDSLMDLFSGALGAHSLALKETDVPGTLRVVSAAQLVAVPNELTREPAADEAPDGGRVVSRVYGFEHTLASRVDELVKPFLTSPGGSSQVIPEQNLLIINDYAGQVRRVDELIALADRPVRSLDFALVPVEHLAAEQLAERVKAVLAGQAEAQGLGKADGRVAIVPEPASNSLVVFASTQKLSQTRELIATLDVGSKLQTRVYRLRVAEAERVDEVMASMLGEGLADKLYRSVPDEQSNELVVTTTPAIHGRIRELVDEIDQPRAAEESPIRFYKLKHAEASELLETLQSIFGQAGREDESDDPDDQPPQDGPEDLGTGRLIDEDGRVTPRPPRAGADSGSAPGSGPAGGIERLSGDLSADLADARVIADESTNTLIVVARPSVQPLYERMIQQLDVRLPQVLLSATIVAIDTTDDFRLGVEFSSSEGADDGTLLNFTQFGLSTVDPNTGDLTLSTDEFVGFNSALLDADVAEVIIQALQSDGRSTIITSPQILVNDNEEGELSSEDEEPIETNVLTGGGASQASFGGFATAGTRITATPSISEGDYLKIEYDIELSSFTETRVSSSLPPSRQTNNLSSKATIPDRSTIVVGGLTREIDSESLSTIPFLGRIPVLRHAFSNQSTSKRKVTLFVFLHARILRDDKFEDLKVLSGSAAGRANLPSEYPESLPVEVR